MRTAENQSIRRRTYPSVTLSTTNHTYIGTSSSLNYMYLKFQFVPYSKHTCLLTYSKPAVTRNSFFVVNRHASPKQFINNGFALRQLLTLCNILMAHDNPVVLNVGHTAPHRPQENDGKLRRHGNFT
jgi:hypothetical protein